MIMFPRLHPKCQLDLRPERLSLAIILARGELKLPSRHLSLPFAPLQELLDGVTTRRRVPDGDTAIGIGDVMEFWPVWLSDTAEFNVHVGSRPASGGIEDVTGYGIFGSHGL